MSAFCKCAAAKFSEFWRRVSSARLQVAAPFILAFGAISLLIGGLIGHRRGHAIGGALLGLLGPLGWIIAAFLPLTVDRQARRDAMIDAARARRRNGGA